MLIARLRSAFSELGGLDATLYLLDRLLRATSAGHARIVRYYIVAQPVPREVRKLRPSANNSIALLDPADPIVATFPRPPEVIARRIANRATCFVARAGEDLAGFLWLARDAYDEDEVRCRYELAEPRLCAWDYDVSVEAPYRLGRTFARLWEAANAHLAGDGVRWSLSRISAFNPGSLAAHRRLGLRKITSASFVCLGPLQLSLLGVPPYLHLSLSARRYPTLRLAPPAAEGAP